MFDSDGSGSISTAEMSRLCEMLEISINEREMQDLMKLMDRDGSGSVDFNEFSRVMAEQFYRTPTQNELEEAFNYFDKGLFLLFFSSNSIFINSIENSNKTKQKQKQTVISTRSKRLHHGRGALLGHEQIQERHIS